MLKEKYLKSFESCTQTRREVENCNNLFPQIRLQNYRNGCAIAQFFPEEKPAYSMDNQSGCLPAQLKSLLYI